LDMRQRRLFLRFIERWQNEPQRHG